MAKIKLNPMYRDVEGKTGDLVHYKWKGMDCARIYVIPRNPDTRAQRLNRKRLGEASKSWKGLPLETRNLYNLRALKHGNVMSGYNLYVSEYMTGSIKAFRAAEGSKKPVERLSDKPLFRRCAPDPLRMQPVPDGKRSMNCHNTDPGVKLRPFCRPKAS